MIDMISKSFSHHGKSTAMKLFFDRCLIHGWERFSSNYKAMVRKSDNGNISPSHSKKRKLKKKTIFIWKPKRHVGILIYRKWSIKRDTGRAVTSGKLLRIWSYEHSFPLMKDQAQNVWKHYPKYGTFFIIIATDHIFMQVLIQVPRNSRTFSVIF